MDSERMCTEKRVYFKWLYCITLAGTVLTVLDAVLLWVAMHWVSGLWFYHTAVLRLVTGTAYGALLILLRPLDRRYLLAGIIRLLVTFLLAVVAAITGMRGAAGGLQYYAAFIVFVLIATFFEIRAHKRCVEDLQGSWRKLGILLYASAAILPLIALGFLLSEIVLIYGSILVFAILSAVFYTDKLLCLKEAAKPAECKENSETDRDAEKQRPTLIKWTVVLTVLVLCAVGIAISSDLGHRPNPNAPSWAMMHVVRDIAGNQIAVTGVTAADSYSAPDGTEYRAEDGGKILVVTCDAELLPGWQISRKTYLHSSKVSGAALLCDAIPGVGSNGQSISTLLFRLKSGEFSGFFEDYRIELYVASGTKEAAKGFLLEDKPTILPLNYVWKLWDDTISVNEVLDTDRYCASDGTEYTAQPGYTLAVLKCRADLTDWRVSDKTCISNHSGLTKMLCAPFVETEESGEYLVLIFHVDPYGYNNAVDQSILTLYMESDWDVRGMRFYLRAE